MKSIIFLLIATTLLLSVESFLLPTQQKLSIVKSTTSRSVLADPPNKSGTAEQQEGDSGNKDQLQPIRRLRRDKKEPLIAVVGRPNVGKSALVNRIAGTQSGGAIVADESGITRDRTYRPAEFLGERFQVCDTGGLVFDDEESTIFAKEIREQAMLAIDEAAAVLFIVDGQTGVTAMDLSIAEFLRKEVVKHIPVLVAVNKCESEITGAVAAANFWELGLGEPLPVSALHGVGTAELLENAFESIAEQKSAIEGFGTKVKNLKVAKEAMHSKEPLPGEDEEDFRLRKKYGLGDLAQKVEEDYEAAIAAFDNEARPEEINIAMIGRPNVVGRYWKLIFYLILEMYLDCWLDTILPTWEKMPASMWKQKESSFSLQFDSFLLL